MAYEYIYLECEIQYDDRPEGVLSYLRSKNRTYLPNIQTADDSPGALKILQYLSLNASSVKDRAYMTFFLRLGYDGMNITNVDGID